MARWKLIIPISILLFCLTGPATGQSTHAGQSRSDNDKDAATERAVPSGAFTHKAVVEGIRAEFQIMTLLSMNMKDPKGATHHIMVTFFNEVMNQKITELIGKVKVIAPSGKDQVEPLGNYGGIYAANFTFDEKGKWGVICLFKAQGKKRTVKFWYPHK